LIAVFLKNQDVVRRLPYACLSALKNAKVNQSSEMVLSFRNDGTRFFAIGLSRFLTWNG